MQTATTFTISSMSGRCRPSRRHGAERGGRLFHVVPGSKVVGDDFRKALCGATPGYRGNGWSFDAGPQVTCPRCLKKLSADGESRVTSDPADVYNAM